MICTARSFCAAFSATLIPLPCPWCPSLARPYIDHSGIEYASHSYVHSKARDRISNERVKKLIYLFQNLRVRDQVLTSTPNYFDKEEV